MAIRFNLGGHYTEMSISEDNNPRLGSLHRYKGTEPKDVITLTKAITRDIPALTIEPIPYAEAIGKMYEKVGI
jgi:hypothetical protein